MVTTAIMSLAATIAIAQEGTEPMIQLRVAAEDTIRECGEFNNGAGPLWCYGSKTIVRDGSTVYASVVDVDPDARPYCNTRWHLYQREDGGTWRIVRAQERAGEREPCPLVLQPEGRLHLSVNTAFEIAWESDNGNAGFHCMPHLLVFDRDRIDATPQTLLPRWDSEYPAFEHSYRGIAAEPTGGIFLTQQVRDGDTHSQAWCYRNADGQWQAGGLLRFPMRGCYPAISLNDKAVHVLAISDEIEPNEEWKAYKKEITGRAWDYDFRQLFYTWTPDVTHTPFSQTLTIASTDETCGHIQHTDIYVDANDDAHVLYIERNIWHPFVRDRFFPGLPITSELKYARISNGRVVERRVLLNVAEDSAESSGSNVVFDGPIATWAAFHPTADGRLLVLWSQTGIDRVSSMLIRDLAADPSDPPAPVPLHTAITRFFAAAPRVGCELSNTIDVYGTNGDEMVVRYAQIAIE